MHSGDECAVKSVHLTATLYSLLAAEPLFQHSAPSTDTEASRSIGNELLLHCSAYEVMGSRLDAEIIVVDNVLEAHVLPPEIEVTYHVHPPPGKGLGRSFITVAPS